MSWRRVARASGDSSDPSHPAQTVSDDVLASALDDLTAGFTPVEILDRYPEHADELGPLLQTAYELRATRWPVMSTTGRVAGRERMHAALNQQSRRKAGFLSPLWQQVGVAAALTLMAGAAFLASPLSPLDFPRRGVQATPAGEPAVVVDQPTSTDTAVPPTLAATSTWTVVMQSPTPAQSITAEPSETPERLVLAERTRVPTAIATRAASPTSRPAPTRTPAPPTATATASAVPTESGVVSGVTPPPAPSATSEPATNTPAPTPIKPSPTVTSRPTEPPAPTATYTRAPTATQTQSPRPTVTSTKRPPTATPVPPTATPEPPTPTSTRAKRTPELTRTPEPTRTPRDNDMPGAALLLRAAKNPPAGIQPAPADNPVRNGSDALRLRKLRP